MNVVPIGIVVCFDRAAGLFEDRGGPASKAYLGAVIAAGGYSIDLVGGPRLDTNSAVCRVFHPG